MHYESGNTTSSQKKIITIPNILSFFRLCLIPVIIWLYTVEKNDAAAGAVLILSGATDVADGFIARHFHMISDLGKVLDPIADKLTQAAMLFSLCTVLLYAAMILHVFWYQIPKTVSDVLIGACAVMILISFVLYARHNVRMLKEQKKDGR